jgi:hypothetical protein
MKDLMRIKCLISLDIETLLNQQIKKKLTLHHYIYQCRLGAIRMDLISLQIIFKAI